jgi:hypothetical protein
MISSDILLFHHVDSDSTILVISSGILEILSTIFVIVMSRCSYSAIFMILLDILKILFNHS